MRLASPKLPLVRGVLSASAHSNGVLDTITNLNATVPNTDSWTLDAVGNATTGNGHTSTFNSQNQIAGISGGFVRALYDNNGNMIRDEQGQTYTYDAWNRAAGYGDVYSFDATADHRQDQLPQPRS